MDKLNVFEKIFGARNYAFGNFTSFEGQSDENTTNDIKALKKRLDIQEKDMQRMNDSLRSLGVRVKELEETLTHKNRHIAQLERGIHILRTHLGLFN